MRSCSKLRKWMYLLGILTVFCIYGITVQADEYDGGPVKVIYAYIGHYSLNYAGNTNNYDYWNTAGTGKIVNRNYKDRTDIATRNIANSSFVVYNISHM